MQDARDGKRAEHIGVYGGTFDPIHNVHLDIARAARREAELDRVLFVVAARPPHKLRSASASAEDRYAMVAAAVADEPGFEASRVELDRRGPSYTADTLAQLGADHPGARLSLIVGVDSLVDLPRWRRPDEIFAAADILALPRPGTWSIPAVLEGRYRLLAFAPSPVSSTEIRRRVADGASLDDLVPPAVRRYIERKGLYDVCNADGPRG